MIINGRKLANELIAELRQALQKFGSLTIGAVVLGKDRATLSFIKQKQRVAQKLDVELKIYQFPSVISETELINKISGIVDSPGIQGIILQLPLPKRLNLKEIVKHIPPEKDIDGLNPLSPVLAPAVEVVKLIFKKYKIKYKGKKVVIIGLGKLVGRPIREWFLSEGIEVVSVVKETSLKERNRLIEIADILISGVGEPGLIPANLVKKEATVIDFGYGLKDNKLYGDVEPAAAKRVKFFTPTPGGTGPVLVSIIFENLLHLLKKTKKQNV